MSASVIIRGTVCLLRSANRSLLRKVHSGKQHKSCISVCRQYAQHSRTHNNRSGNPFVNYLRSLKWVPIPVGVGFAYIGYQQYGHVVKREERRIQSATDPEELVANDLMVTIYKCLPLKIMSRAWGRINDVDLPVWMREPLYKAYIWAFGCNLTEAAVQDLQYYKNLGQFFRRRLSPAVRPVDKHNSVISPSDGKVLYFGKADEGLLEQVKGIRYSIQDFLGPQTWPTGTDCNNNVTSSKHDDSDSTAVMSLDSHHKLSRTAYQRRLKTKPENELYHCVIYLAPGDYHGFHSPVDWAVSYRRHFPGELFSVNPGIARLVKGLFNFNERAVYIGQWEKGFFAMVAVGATNVGSIKIYHDTQLVTNRRGRHAPGTFCDKMFPVEGHGGIPLKKGDAFGEFNLGSTIVLLFEAPKTFEFKIEEGQKIKCGQPLGCYNNNSSTEH